MIHGLIALLRRLRADRRGNVLMIMGFAMIPMTFAVGMGIDYSRAARTQTKLNAVTDAAALAAVTPTMLTQTRFQSAVAAVSMWYAQAGVGQCSGATVNRVSYNSCNVPGYGMSDDGTTFTGYDGTLRITVKDTTGTGFSRVVTITWNAFSGNIFSSVLGSSSIQVGGTSTTNAKQAPNIDFYLLVDSSGSMAIPSTSAGISQLQSITGGCAFACHSTNDLQARTQGGTMADYYTVANSYGIPLRITAARDAVQSMMSTATQTGQNNNATYRAALSSFAAISAQANNSYKTLSGITTNLSSVSTSANGIQTSLYYSNNCPTSSYCNSDTDTASSDAFTRMNSLMPAPGNGTKVAGDPPQEIMFIITDGMRDEYRAGGRPEIAFDTNLCTTIKARGIRIGIIYTEYVASALANDAWSQSNVAPYMAQVEPALQACASTGLYYKVQTDSDISQALNQLFQAAVATAHITH